MDCPRCGSTTTSAPECPRCGVILTRARPPRASRAAAPGPSHAGRRPSRRVAVGAVLLVVGAGAAYVAWRGTPAVPAAGVTLAPPARPDPPPVDAPEPLALSPEPPGVAPAESAALAAQAGAVDRETAYRLAAALRTRSRLSPADLRDAEGLQARHPEAARSLLEAVLVSAAWQEREAGRPAAALPLLEQAARLSPTSQAPRRGLLAVRLSQQDWTATETAAREVLALAPADPDAVRALAHALVRLDRSRQADELLTSFLQSHEDAQARALLERVRRDAATETPLEEQRIAHFHLRYDGEAHEDVGREVLRVLERHYATLVRTFDHEPAEVIPVVLLSQESYYDATGAPSWSGGLYDDFDGRVRIPIGGLGVGLDPRLDATVLHELTHAFVAGRSSGLAPRVLHEGLAQLMEGKRSATALGGAGLQALADGRLRGVGGFYLEALAFVEDLVARRGQGGINDLLAEMARGRDVDAAFRQVYGRELGPLQADWRARLRQRHGS